MGPGTRRSTTPAIQRAHETAEEASAPTEARPESPCLTNSTPRGLIMISFDLPPLTPESTSIRPPDESSGGEPTFNPGIARWTYPRHRAGQVPSDDVGVVGELSLVCLRAGGGAGASPNRSRSVESSARLRYFGPSPRVWTSPAPLPRRRSSRRESPSSTRESDPGPQHRAPVLPPRHTRERPPGPATATRCTRRRSSTATSPASG